MKKIRLSTITTLLHYKYIKTTLNEIKWLDQITIIHTAKRKIGVEQKGACASRHVTIIGKRKDDIIPLPTSTHDHSNQE